MIEALAEEAGKDPRRAPELLESLARGALTGGADGWELEGRAAVHWLVAQAVEIKQLLRAISRGERVK